MLYLELDENNYIVDVSLKNDVGFDIEATEEQENYFKTASLSDQNVQYVNGEFVIDVLKPIKNSKKIEIREAFEIESEQPILVDAVKYHGGFDSSVKLDGAKRLAELAGLVEVTFYDTSNQFHILTIAEANNVIIQVAAKYQTDFAKKQILMTQIDAATTFLELRNIFW